ncbi:MAG TPA: BatA domain-containing protein [Prosthecobacter sp.]|nr:BatA domain-containing protein [Prosthecobacter sp.]
MTFLVPALLLALPLAALPVVIHLIHLYRRRQVKWAAMMFLRMAQRMNKGLSRLRQILILAFRVLAVAAILFVITRPMAGGLLGLTGGVPDTVIVLLDRSASMEQQNLATGTSKRAASLAKLSQALRDTVGTRSKLVLIENAHLQPQLLEKPESLVDLPLTGATDTTADIPALLQGALDYITTNQTGRTDVWVLSDLRQSDWDAASGRWQALRSAFTSLKGLRFHLLAYAQPAPQDLSVAVERVMRRETADKAELLLDLRITRDTASPAPTELPLRFVINDVSTTMKVEMKDAQLVLQGYAIPIDKTTKRGSGRVELPADASPSDNVFHFVFDEPAVLRSLILTDDETEAGPLQAALEAAADPTRKYAATILPVSRAAEIAWDDTALIIWHAALPKADDLITQQLTNHLKTGRSILFLPIETPNTETFGGLHWGAWSGDSKPAAVEWWRNDTGLLANTRSGTALPVGELEVSRHCEILGEGTPLARLGENVPLLMRADLPGEGGAWFLGTLTGSGSSSLARDGVVMFAMLHRALNAGARSLGKAQQREAASAESLNDWKRLGETMLSSEQSLRAGVLTKDDKLIALNRPLREDRPETLGKTALAELFAGLDHHIIEDQVENETSLASEIWRTFLFLMALALLGEALLCMPGKLDPQPSPAT